MPSGSPKNINLMTQETPTSFLLLTKTSFLLPTKTSFLLPTKTRYRFENIKQFPAGISASREFLLCANR